MDSTGAQGSWQERLASSRQAEGLSQARLAGAAGVSLGALKAYEQRRREPSRAVLTRLLSALKLDRRQRNEILAAAGYVPDGPWIGPQNPDYLFSLEEAKTYIEARRWPAAVMSELMEVLAANRLLQAVWGVDLSKELNTPVERNILSVISLPRFDGQLLNWDQVVAAGIAVIKGHYLGAETQPEGSSAYFQAVMQHFVDGDPKYLTKFLTLWEQTPGMTGKIRWQVPVRWNHPVAGLMDFEVVLNTANDPNGLAFSDYIPLDAGTWTALERLRV